MGNLFLFMRCFLVFCYFIFISWDHHPIMDLESPKWAENVQNQYWLYGMLNLNDILRYARAQLPRTENFGQFSICLHKM